MKWHNYPDEKPEKDGLYLVVAPNIMNNTLVMRHFTWRESRWFTLGRAKYGFSEDYNRLRVNPGRIKFWAPIPWPDYKFE